MGIELEEGLVRSRFQQQPAREGDINANGEGEIIEENLQSIPVPL